MVPYCPVPFSTRRSLPMRSVESRAARKRRAILDAATTLFLRQGYPGTSTGQVAELAGVSKQTLYKYFADKDQLLRAVVLGAVAGTVDQLVAALAVLSETTDLERDLSELARWYIGSVIRPNILQLRRLVIAEAARLPELGRAYYQQAVQRS